MYKLKFKFAPSLMCMNFLKLKEQIEFLNTKADFFHVDIMDGHYVRNITLSPLFIEQIKPISRIPIDAHLMVDDPLFMIEMVAKSGADYITVHAETIWREAFRIISLIKSYNCRVGIALNPSTSVEQIKYYIHLIDKITIMTVDPGFAGQPFIEEMLRKISEVKNLKERNNYNFLIEVDGSCNKKTFKNLIEAGTEVFVIGSSGLFSLSEDIANAWELMQKDFSNALQDINIKTAKGVWNEE